MAMVALEPYRSNRRDSAIICTHPPINSFFNLDDEMDLNFMDTFDHVMTVGDRDMEWSTWAKKNQVEERVLGGGEHFLLIAFLGFSSYIRNDWNRADMIDSTYSVECELHSGEKEYLEFLHFVLSLKSIVA